MTAPLLALLLVACGADEPAVCGSIDELQVSIDNLQDIQLTEGGVASMRDDLRQVGQDLDQVLEDAQDEYGDEVDTIRADVTQTREAVRTATRERSADAVSAVGTALTTLREDVAALNDAVSDTC